MESTNGERRMLQSLKKELKGWESMFERKHSRKPSKTDIENSPAEIQDAYRQYRHLKSHPSHIDGALNEVAPPSFPVPTGDEEVFGRTLNKPVKVKEDENAPSGEQRKPVWKLRRWTKGKGYVTVANDNSDPATSGGMGDESTGKDVSSKNGVANKDEKDIIMEPLDTRKCSELENELKSLSLELNMTHRTVFKSTSKEAHRSLVSGECQNILLTQKTGNRASRQKHTSRISSQWLGRCKPEIEISDSKKDDASISREEAQNVQLKELDSPKTFKEHSMAEFLEDWELPASPHLNHYGQSISIDDDFGTWSGDGGSGYSDSNDEDDPVISVQKWDELSEARLLEPTHSTYSNKPGPSTDIQAGSSSIMKAGSSPINSSSTADTHTHSSLGGTATDQCTSELESNVKKTIAIQNTLSSTVSRSVLGRLESHHYGITKTTSHSVKTERKVSKPKQWTFNRDNASTVSKLNSSSFLRHEKKQPSVKNAAKQRFPSPPVTNVTGDPTMNTANQSKTEKEIACQKLNESRSQTGSLATTPDPPKDFEFFDSEFSEAEVAEIERMETAEAEDSQSKNIPSPSIDDSSECTGTKDTSTPTLKKNSSVKTGLSTAVSENFVRINIKVKRFSRNKKGLTGSAHKRIAWKKMQKSRAGGGGSGGGGGGGGGSGLGKGGRSVCYKCGNPGHWAKNCDSNVGSKNLGKFDGEDVGFSDKMAAGDEEINSAMFEQLAKESPFPSVEDAAKMACGVKFAAAKEERSKTPTTSQSDDDGDGGNTTESSFIPPPPSYSRTTPCSRSVEPLFTTEDGKITATPKSVYSVLRKFGYNSFRSGQEEAVMRVLSGVSTLLINSTGSGKSLCYQLPAYLYCQASSCLALIISPLVSLMEDQVQHFPDGLKGGCLHTSQTRPQREKVLKDAVEGRLNVLLLSPEALVGGALWSKSWGGGLSLSQLPPVAFACIDEAHCVSEWSHNFRPSYLRIYKVLRERLGVYCILALTATATHQTAVSVATNLGIVQENIIRGPTLPDNLHVSVSCDQDRDQALVELLQNSTFKFCESIIIYCTRQQETERVAQLLRTCLTAVPSSETGMERDVEEETVPIPKSRKRKNLTSSKKGSKRQKINWSAECYHAGLQASRRRKVQSDFMSGRLRIVVATVAFGMGLNKSDVRAIIHYNLPKSFESFVQEIGRAGRDGLPAYCHVFIDKMGGDLSELRRHAYSNTVERYCIKQLVGRVFPSCQCEQVKRKSDEGSLPSQSECASPPKISRPRWCNGHEVAFPIDAMVTSLDVKEECVSTLLCYLELEDWLEVMNPLNDTCKLNCYNGARQLRALASKVPAVAAATARLGERGTDLTQSSSIEFSLVEVADSMGWETSIVRSELSGLSHNDRGTGGPNTKASTVLVEFGNLSFHLRAPGDLRPDEKDLVCDFLYTKVKMQEERDVEKLHLFHAVLHSVTGQTHEECFENEQETAIRLDTLNKMIKRYFSESGLNSAHLQEMNISVLHSHSTLTPERERRVCDDIHSLISIHSDQQFTGRAIARIFHGIASPLFEAVVWGGQKRFWRRHMDVDFNLLCQLATKEVLKFR